MREGDSVDAGGALAGEPMAPDNAPAQDLSADPLEWELGGYIVRARRADCWDAVLTLLAALEAGHGDYFHTVMRGCRRLSNSRSEIDGLDDLLLAPEQHLHDVTVERERRRAQQGYATPADARAFLHMARQPKETRSAAAMTGLGAINPIVAAYFRAADAASESSTETARRPERLPASSEALHSSDVQAHATGVPDSVESVIELLAEAGLVPERPRALLEAGDAAPQAVRLTRLRPLLTYVRDTDEMAYFTRTRELAFLANTLLAGCSVQSRPFTPQEASDAAASVCNLGLESWPARWAGGTPAGVSAVSGTPLHDTPESFLVDHDLVTAFEVGWSVLHQDVSLFAADQLISMLGDVDCSDRGIRRGLTALRRTLVAQRAAGTPWAARDPAEILAMLDMTAWISVLGLLDECPVVPAALTAVLEGRTTTISATAFAFISTAAQIGDIRVFMRRLPDLLSR